MLPGLAGSVAGDPSLHRALFSGS